MDRDDEYYLNLISVLLETYSIEDIFNTWTDYEAQEIILHLYRSGFFNTTLKNMTMELDFSGE